MTTGWRIFGKITSHTSGGVAEVLLVRIFAHVDEGQDDERGFIGKRQRGWGAGCWGLVLEMGDDQ